MLIRIISIKYRKVNEAWGQFSTEEVVRFTNEKDPLRLINAASGGNHRNCSDFLDLHSYPEPSQFLEKDYLINVIGEYGGIPLEIKNHTWEDDNFGYIVLNDEEELTETYEEYINKLIELIKTGVSAAIYTQITDVEGEVNGLITYDREVVKIFEERVKAANKKIIESLQDYF